MSVIIIMMFMFGAAAGVGKYFITDLPITRRYIVGTGMVHGTSSLTASFIIIGVVWLKDGRIEITAPMILAMIGASLLIAKIGNDRLTSFVYRLANKVAGIKDDRTDRMKAIERYGEQITDEELEEAIETYLKKRSQIAEYMEKQRAKKAEEDSEMNRIRKLLDTGEYDLDELRAKKNEGRK